MIPCFIEIFEGGKYEYSHSKSITKPKYKLHPHLALQQDILSQGAQGLHYKLFFFILNLLFLQTQQKTEFVQAQIRLPFVN